MMKAGSETGSSINHVMSRSTFRMPSVGDGATILLWTDRKAATVVKVTKTQIHVREDIATRIDKNGMSEDQEYEYQYDPKAPIRVFRQTKRGYRDTSGSGICFGIRRSYHDYNF